MYTSGNRPMDQLSNDTNYSQPINTDTSYGADGWGNIWALGIDYFNGSIRGMGANIGLDRYGRQQFGFKGTYSMSPGRPGRWALTGPSRLCSTAPLTRRTPRPGRRVLGAAAMPAISAPRPISA